MVPVCFFIVFILQGAAQDHRQDLHAGLQRGQSQEQRAI